MHGKSGKLSVSCRQPAFIDHSPDFNMVKAYNSGGVKVTVIASPIANIFLDYACPKSTLVKQSCFRLMRVLLPPDTNSVEKPLEFRRLNI